MAAVLFNVTSEHDQYLKDKKTANILKIIKQIRYRGIQSQIKLVILLCYTYGVIASYIAIYNFQQIPYQTKLAKMTK